MGEALLVRKSGGIATASNVIANPVNSFSISGTYANSTYYDADHSGYAVTPCGDILIYIKTTNTSYENVNFVSTTGLPSYIEIINYDMYTQFSNSFATGENIRMYACLIKGVWSKLLNISVNLSAIDGTYDYITADITITETTGTRTYITNNINTFSISNALDSVYFIPSGSGYAINPNGNVLLFAQGGSSSGNEHISFNPYSLASGVSLYETITTAFSSSGKLGFIYPCILTGISQKSDISINLSTTNATYDYVQADVTVTTA